MSSKLPQLMITMGWFHALKCYAPARVVVQFCSDAHREGYITNLLDGSLPGINLGLLSHVVLVGELLLTGND